VDEDFQSQSKTLYTTKKTEANESKSKIGVKLDQKNNKKRQHSI
jgi:hypothetical protein